MSPLAPVASAARCPACNQPLLLAIVERGINHCGDCNQEFEAEPFPRAPRAPVRQPLAAGAASASSCARHPRNAAVAACDECGAFACSLCKVDFQGRAVCTSCFEKLSKPGGLGTAPLRSYRTLAWSAAALGLLIFPLDLFFAPIVFAATIASRRQSRAWGDDPLPSVWPLYLLGAVELAIGVFYVLVFLSILKK